VAYVLLLLLEGLYRQKGSIPVQGKDKAWDLVHDTPSDWVIVVFKAIYGVLETLWIQ
jgi:hypothetical protein